MFENEMTTIYNKLKENLPPVWYGKECILEMRANGCKQWRQMEWPGFYFQYKCEWILGSDCYMIIPGPRYGNVTFDGHKIIPWDFKAHSIDPTKGDDGKIPTNGYSETLCAIDEFGTVGFIIITGMCSYDDDRQTFKKWHDELKGGISNYEKDRISRSAPSRRKTVFIPKELIFVFIDKENINHCGKFQDNFRNSNGTARNPKILLNLNNNSNLKIYKYKF